MKSLLLASAAVFLMSATCGDALQVPNKVKSIPAQPKKRPTMTEGTKHMHVGKSLETVEGHRYPGRFVSKYGNGTNQQVGGSIWPVSIYWTTVEVGTPLKSYAVAIDSGSFDMYLGGVGCQGCVTTAPNTQYDPSKSSTSSPVGHNFSATYQTCNPTHPTQTCTISGPEYYDMASLGGYDAVQVKMGTIEYQTSNFYQFQTIDGIIGMVGGDQGTVFYQQCIVAGKCDPVWAICMNEGSKSNGTITIGGIDESLSTGKIEYVPSSNMSTWHEVNVHHMDFAGNKVSLNPDMYGPAILDTGTNDILLPDAAFNQVQSDMCSDSSLKHCNEFFSNGTFCAALTDTEVAAYPDITFKLDNNVELKITAKDYLLKHSPAAAPGQYCFGLSNGNYYLIFGDTIMQNYYLVFAEQHVGWGPVNRDKCGSI